MCKSYLAESERAGTLVVLNSSARFRISVRAVRQSRFVFCGILKLWRGLNHTNIRCQLRSRRRRRITVLSPGKSLYTRGIAPRMKTPLTRPRRWVFAANRQALDAIQFGWRAATGDL